MGQVNVTWLLVTCLQNLEWLKTSHQISLKTSWQVYALYKVSFLVKFQMCKCNWS